MASLQEINAKRKELMGTGQFTNEKEAAVAARNQLTPAPTITGSGSVAPITPVTPTVPNPLPTVNALGGTVENRQNTRNVVTGKGATETPSGALLDAN